MATKKTKTLRSQYEELLKAFGKTMSDCLVLGFKFQSQGQANRFHYALMEQDYDYYSYDGATPEVKILVDKVDTQMIEKITKLALSLSATQITPIIDR